MDAIDRQAAEPDTHARTRTPSCYRQAGWLAQLLLLLPLSPFPFSPAQCLLPSLRFLFCFTATPDDPSFVSISIFIHSDSQYNTIIASLPYYIYTVYRSIYASQLTTFVLSTRPVSVASDLVLSPLFPFPRFFIYLYLISLYIWHISFKCTPFDLKHMQQSPLSIAPALTPIHLPLSSSLSTSTNEMQFNQCKINLPPIII